MDTSTSESVVDHYTKPGNPPSCLRSTLDTVADLKIHMVKLVDVITRKGDLPSDPENKNGYECLIPLYVSLLKVKQKIDGINETVANRLSELPYMSQNVFSFIANEHLLRQPKELVSSALFELKSGPIRQLAEVVSNFRTCRELLKDEVDLKFTILFDELKCENAKLRLDLDAQERALTSVYCATPGPSSKHRRKHAESPFDRTVVFELLEKETEKATQEINDIQHRFEVYKVQSNQERSRLENELEDMKSHVARCERELEESRSSAATECKWLTAAYQQMSADLQTLADRRVPASLFTSHSRALDRITLLLDEISKRCPWLQSVLASQMNSAKQDQFICLPNPLVLMKEQTSALDQANLERNDARCHLQQACQELEELRRDNAGLKERVEQLESECSVVAKLKKENARYHYHICRLLDPEVAMQYALKVQKQSQQQPAPTKLTHDETLLASPRKSCLEAPQQQVQQSGLQTPASPTITTTTSSGGSGSSSSPSLAASVLSKVGSVVTALANSISPAGRRRQSLTGQPGSKACSPLSSASVGDAQWRVSDNRQPSTSVGSTVEAENKATFELPLAGPTTSSGDFVKPLAVGNQFPVLRRAGCKRKPLGELLVVSTASAPAATGCSPVPSTAGGKLMRLDDLVDSIRFCDPLAESTGQVPPLERRPDVLVRPSHQVASMPVTTSTGSSTDVGSAPWRSTQQQPMMVATGLARGKPVSPPQRVSEVPAMISFCSSPLASSTGQVPPLPSHLLSRPVAAIVPSSHGGAVATGQHPSVSRKVQPRSPPNPVTTGNVARSSTAVAGRDPLLRPTQRPAIRQAGGALREVAQECNPS